MWTLAVAYVDTTAHRPAAALLIRRSCPRGHRPQDISQEDAWTVINSFFEEKGLVGQQLDSFNEFVSNTMQEVVDESPEIVVKPENQHTGGAGAFDEEFERKEYRIKFGQIYLSKPSATEPDGETITLFPKEARLRNLTYSAPMYINVTQSVHTTTAEGEELEPVVTEHREVPIAKVGGGGGGRGARLVTSR